MTELAAGDQPVSRAKIPSPGVFELRQYTLVDGERDTLVNLFDAFLLDAQEEAGMRIVGQFRDLDAENRFVWIRRFPDMQARKDALAAFYYGPVWSRHRESANATMVDSDNVLLLRSIDGGVRNRSVGAPSADEATQAVVCVRVYPIAGPAAAALLDSVARHWPAAATALGGEAVLQLVTEPAENTFPQLPVRTGENVIVTVTRFADASAFEQYRQDRGQNQLFALHMEALASSLVAEPCELRLAPTSRSRLR